MSWEAGNSVVRLESCVVGRETGHVAPGRMHAHRLAPFTVPGVSRTAVTVRCIEQALLYMSSSPSTSSMWTNGGIAVGDPQMCSPAGECAVKCGEDRAMLSHNRRSSDGQFSRGVVVGGNTESLVFHALEARRQSVAYLQAHCHQIRRGEGKEQAQALVLTVELKDRNSLHPVIRIFRWRRHPGHGSLPGTVWPVS